MRIEIPFKTPTINHLYWHRGNVKIMKKEAKELKVKIKKICDGAIWDPIENKKLKVIVEVYENWYTKKGDVKRKDISNREKFLIDAIFSSLGIDDKFIFEQTMIKKQSSDEEKAIITIEEIK